MQFGLLRFQRGRYRWQGGFGTARVVERILLTSGVAVVVAVGGGCGLAATSVMAVRTADRAVVMLLRRRLAGQAAGRYRLWTSVGLGLVKGYGMAPSIRALDNYSERNAFGLHEIVCGLIDVPLGQIDRTILLMVVQESNVK